MPDPMDVQAQANMPPQLPYPLNFSEVGGIIIRKLCLGQHFPHCKSMAKCFGLHGM